MKFRADEFRFRPNGRIFPLVFWVWVLLLSGGVHGGEVPRIAGFEPVDAPAFYDPGNVWNAINGAAEIHLDYGFKELIIQKYKKGDREIELEIFDQAKAINALGIFRRERPPESKVYPIGGEAALEKPYTCMMWKGTFLVRARFTKGEFGEALCKEVLFGVAKSLPGEDGLPELLRALPLHNRFVGSVNFTPRGYLGIGDLPHVLHATYKFRNFEKAELFRILTKDAGEADGIIDRLSEKWKTVQGYPNVKVRDIPYKGKVVISKTGDSILGMVAPGELKFALEWLENQFKGLARNGVCTGD